MKKVIIFAIILLGIVIITVSVLKKDIKIETLDINNDGKIDLWKYCRGKHLFKEIFDNNFNGTPDFWIFWRGEELLKEVLLDEVKGEKHTHYYKKGEYVVKNGERLLQQEMDIVKTYKRPRRFRVLIYTKKNKTVLEENYTQGYNIPTSISCFEDVGISRTNYDTNHDGKPDRFEYYEFSKLAKVEKDTDFDEKIDEIRELNPETGELEIISQEPASILTQ
ncbi:MAG: hypothetical protein HY810_04165 [Candidatus Omnitrophica bacterium]|nr:hypothetical protein [Candidatus Omnitrophota bacterium]